MSAARTGVRRRFGRTLGSLRTARWAGFAAIGAFVIIGAAVAQTPPGHAGLTRLGLAPTPARYTELAWVHPTALPTVASATVAPVRVAFTIHNLEGAPWVYHWKLTSTNGAHHAPLAAGSVDVKPGARATLTQRVRVFCPSGRTQVSVRLNRAEAIDFWLTCPTTSTTKAGS